MTEWEWYDDHTTFKVFLHLLLVANHKSKKWRGHVVNPGEKITSYGKLAEQTSLTVRQVRTALKKLKLTGEVTTKTNNKFTLVKINNWENYQHSDKQDDNQMTGKRQSNDRQATTNKNDNNEKNEKKVGRFAPPSILEVREYVAEKGYLIDPENFVNFYESKGWMVGKNKMKSWKACVSTWQKREQKKSGTINERTLT